MSQNKMYHPQGKPVLSISLLVSNHKDTIRNCMESIKPLLEQVSSELIVVDTGSIDGSIEIAKEYTEHIVSFTWCNDFSAARNAGLKQANGEWFLYLDDDEWFEDVSEIVSFFKSGEYKKYHCARYVQRNYATKTGEKYSDAYVERMAKITPELSFCSRIHEHFAPTGNAIKMFTNYVHHYGYVYASEAEALKKSERNIPLIELELQDNPNNLHMQVQLIQEYKAIKDYNKARLLCEEVLAKNKDNYKNAFVQYCMVNLPRIIRNSGNAEEAEKVLAEVKETYPLGTLAALGCAVEAVMAAAKQGKLEEILVYLKDYFSEKKKLEGNGDAAKYYEVMDFASYTSKKTEHMMLELGKKAMLQSRQYELAEELFQRVEWGQLDKMSSENRERWLKLLFASYGTVGKAEWFYPHLRPVLELTELWEEAEKAVEVFLQEYPDRRTEFVSGIEEFHLRMPYFLLFHIEYCLQTQNGEVIREAIQNYFSVSKGKHDAFLVSTFLTNPDYITEVLKQVDFQTFREGVTYKLQNRQLPNLFAVSAQLNHLQAVCGEEFEVYFLYLQMVLCEEMLLLQESEYTKAVADYVEATLEYAKAYFSGLLLQPENWCMLPRNCQFAFWMKQAEVSKEEGNGAAWTEYVKCAAKAYPVMLPVVQAMLKEEAQKNQKAKVSPELLQLAEELKKNIRELINLRQIAEAKKLLNGLMQYVPEDEEIAELKEAMLASK